MRRGPGLLVDLRGLTPPRRGWLRVPGSLVAACLLWTACAGSSVPPPAPPAAKPAAAAETNPAAAPSPAAAPTSVQARAVALEPPQTVRVASVGLAAQASTYLALEQGYFRELGIAVEIVPLVATNEMIVMLSSDQLDVGFGQITPGFFNAVARGIGVRMVADHGTNYPGRSNSSYAVRADLLAEKPWAGFQSLRGLKIGLSDVNAQSAYFLERALALGGVQPSDVEIVGPMTYPDMAMAFANQAIDAANFQEPWAIQQEQQGIIKRVAYLPDVEPGGHVAGLLFSEGFAHNTAAARNYLVAYLRGVRDWWDAFDGRTDYGHVVAVLQKHSVLKDGDLLRRLPQTGQNPDGYLDPAKLAAYQDWFAAQGLVPQKAAIEQAYDPSFADYANTVLGRYQPVETPRRPN